MNLISACWTIVECAVRSDYSPYIRALSRTSLTVVRDMLPRGNAFLAGCDGSVPGFCLHDELQILTEAALSALQALQTATINPARLPITRLAPVENRTAKPVLMLDTRLRSPGCLRTLVFPEGVCGVDEADIPEFTRFRE